MTLLKRNGRISITMDASVTYPDVVRAWPVTLISSRSVSMLNLRLVDEGILVQSVGDVSDLDSSTVLAYFDYPLTETLPDSPLAIPVPLTIVDGAFSYTISDVEPGHRYVVFLRTTTDGVVTDGAPAAISVPTSWAASGSGPRHDGTYLYDGSISYDS